LVEDDKFILSVFSCLLQAEGAEIVWAKSGQEALDKLSREKIDVVLSDRLISPISSDELFKIMHEDQELTNVPKSLSPIRNAPKKMK